MNRLETNDSIESWDLTVVYDREDGTILHSHHTVTWRGGVHPEAEERERAAREHAAREADAEPERMAVLHAEPLELEPEALFRVDPDRRVLVVERRLAG